MSWLRDRGTVFWLLLALLVLPSKRLRGWLKVTLAKHFFQHRYDYREEWLRFTRTIGNGGAEYGVRGYVGAYDAATGERVWRFYTVPGDPSLGFESPEMESASETWHGEWWKLGGGGTVWDSMA